MITSAIGGGLGLGDKCHVPQIFFQRFQLEEQNEQIYSSDARMMARAHLHVFSGVQCPRCCCNIAACSLYCKAGQGQYSRGGSKESLGIGTDLKEKGRSIHLHMDTPLFASYAYL